jgi:cytidine deaminase
MKKEHRIEYEQFAHWNELNEADRKLVTRAYEASESAYAPYSNFNVGAAVRTSAGEIIIGNNQENIAYPSGICAERVALFYLGATQPSCQIDTLAVVAKGNLIAENQLVTPCGSCRQVMSESEKRQQNPIRLILVAQNGEAVIFDKTSDLLVFPFGMEL